MKYCFGLCDIARTPTQTRETPYGSKPDLPGRVINSITLNEDFK